MVGHVARMGQRDSVVKPQRKRTLERHRRRYIHLQEEILPNNYVSSPDDTHVG
jgi:hypothetical protein